MASVKSHFRSLIKPALFRLLGESGYEYFQYLGKVKDIRGRLVEEAEMELFPTLVGAEDEVLDVGANYAYHTHRLAGLCPGGRVYAFEPIPFTYRVCRRIVEHFHLKNVELYQKGVGEQCSETTFRAPIVDFGAISGGQSHMASRNNNLDGRVQHYNFGAEREFVCSVVAIDKFLPNLRKLSFVKMDIEGAEMFALRGMVETLRRLQPVIMLEINPFFLNGFSIDEAEIWSFFQEHGYQLYRYAPEQRRLRLYDQKTFREANYLALTETHQQKFYQIIDKGD